MLRYSATDTRLRIELAGDPRYGLTRLRRLAELQQALWLDDQLAPDEPKRLKPEERRPVEETIRQVDGERDGASGNGS